MTVQIAFLGLSEGATFDARGQMALVGFMPKTWAIEQFPATVGMHLVMVLDDDRPHGILSRSAPELRIAVTNDSGDVVFVAEQTPPVQNTTDDDLPTRVAMVAAIPVTVSKSGRYTFRVRLRFTGDSEEDIQGTTSLFVTDAHEVATRKQARTSA